MRRNIILLAIFCIALFCGCDSNDLPSSDANPDMSDTGLFCDFVGEYPTNELSLLTTGEEDVCREINAQKNFKCAQNLYVNIPDSASVCEFKTYGVHVPQFEYNVEQYSKDFEALFKYLFPDREINMDYLKYYKYLGYDNEKKEYLCDEGYVKDKSVLPNDVQFFYDEMPERTEIWNFPIYIELKEQIGVGSGVINKGETAYLVGKAEYNPDEHRLVTSDTYNTLHDFEPGKLLENVGRFSPKSEKSFNLIDGETRICDSVDFFENYINNIPISTGLQRNVRTSVYSVDVLKIGDNTYGYYFKTVPQFQGVDYEPCVYGSHSAYDYDPPGGGEAFMIRSNDVDYIHSIYCSIWTFDVGACDKIVPVETAIKTISDELSDNVTFEVLSVEFVYVQQYVKDELGHINIKTYEANTTPAWRITAGNLNDNRTYMCYVDAKDGGNFRYYTMPGIKNYD